MGELVLVENLLIFKLQLIFDAKSYKSTRTRTYLPICLVQTRAQNPSTTFSHKLSIFKLQQQSFIT